MEYRYEEKDRDSRVWKDKKKHAWSMIGRDRFMKLTKGKAVIAGDVGLKGKASGDALTDGEYSLPLYETRQKPGFFQKITGYIPCTDGENRTYVRVVERAAGKILALLLLLAVLIAGGILLYLNTREEGPELDKAAISYEMPDTMINTDPDSIALPGYSILTMSNADGVVHAPLINPAGNTCYFVYSVKLADTGEEIYKSGYIEPGSAVPEFELNRTLEPGEYDILLEVEAWDIEDYTQALNGGSIEARLTVED